MDVVRTDISGDMEKYYGVDGHRPVGNYVFCSVNELSRDGATSSNGGSTGGSARIEAENPQVMKIGPDQLQNGFVQLPVNEKGDKEKKASEKETEKEDATKEGKE